jgi:hypothetical protein
MSENGDDKSLEYLYKEYVRLNDKCDAYAQLSFSDIKLLAAIGVLLAWKPIADSRLIGTGNSNGILLFGFIAILFIVSILGARSLMVTSVIAFYLRQIKIYEHELREQLHGSSGQTFSFAKNWEKWDRTVHLPLSRCFHALFLLAVVLFPVAVLLLQSPFWYAFVYLGVALVILAIYGYARIKVIGEL